jgi:uncharacterized lipoprotein NlpE involved in copper resistance
MKKSILALFIMVFVLVSCNQKNKENEPVNATTMEQDTTMMMTDTTMNHNETKMKQDKEKLYACPMHPEVQGKLNETCSKCGMKLTVVVK